MRIIDNVEYFNRKTSIKIYPCRLEVEKDFLHEEVVTRDMYEGLGLHEAIDKVLVDEYMHNGEFIVNMYNAATSMFIKQETGYCIYGGKKWYKDKIVVVEPKKKLVKRPATIKAQ